MEFRLDAQLLEAAIDFRAAAVHDDGVHADVLQQGDVFGDAVPQYRVFHRRAAVFDDDGLSFEFANVGQRLHERRHFLDKRLHLFH